MSGQLSREAVTFAPDGWDERTQSPVDEQAESLVQAEPYPVCVHDRAVRDGAWCWDCQ